jgi:hypothetical protein
VGWSIVHDQEIVQWKILLPKVVTDRGGKTLGHPSLAVGTPQTPKRVFLMFLKALGFSEWYMSSGLTLQFPEALARKSNASRSFIGLWPSKVVSSFVICVLRGNSLPEKDSSVAVQLLLRNKASLLSYSLKFLKIC